MSFEATKKEWSELYSFFRLLADGFVCTGTSDGKRDPDNVYPVAMIQRQEHDGTRRYIIQEAHVHISGEMMDIRIPRTKFGEVAKIVLECMKDSSQEMIESPEGVEDFLNSISLYDLEARTEDRTDFYIAFWNSNAPLIGCSVRSRIGGMNVLLDGGRTANLKFELSGIKFAVPTVNKVNALKTPNEVADRMLMIERLGGTLKFADVADKVFRGNLSMIDLHFPRMLAEMVRVMHLDGITRVSELTERIKESNPLKIKDDLINKHGFYEYKIKQFLLALALGMRPAKLFKGADSAVSGFIFIDGTGEPMCYQKFDKEGFQDFLYYNTRFEKGSVDKDKYGFLERENGIYYFKLNLKIGLLKR